MESRSTAATKRKTYAQGRRDERAAIARAMQPRERIVAEARFEHLQINGRAFSGRGKIEIYEEGFVGGFSGSSRKFPGFCSWRVKMAPRGVSTDDKEFMFGLLGKMAELIVEPDGPTRCRGQIMMDSLPVRWKGPNHWRFEGSGQLTMEPKDRHGK